RILCCHTRWTSVCVAFESLDASQSKHHGPRRITGICAQDRLLEHMKACCQPARGKDLGFLPKARAYERSVHQMQAFFERRTHRVGELKRSRSRATLRTVDCNEIRHNSRRNHGLDDCKPLIDPSNTKLEANGFATGEFSQSSDESQKAFWSAECCVRGWRNYIPPERNTANFSDLASQFGSRQNPTVCGLRALRELDFDHLD